MIDVAGSDGYLISKDVEPDWRSNYRGDYRNATVRPIKTSDLLCWSFQIARGMEYLASRKVSIFFYEKKVSVACQTAGRFISKNSHYISHRS